MAVDAAAVILNPASLAVVIGTLTVLGVLQFMSSSKRKEDEEVQQEVTLPKVKFNVFSKS